MSFELRFHKDQTTGLICVCDLCNKPITNSKDGLVVWLPHDVKPVTILNYYTVHKGKCDHEMESRNGGHMYSQELDTGLGYLLNNTKTNIKEMLNNMSLLHMIG